MAETLLTADRPEIDSDRREFDLAESVGDASVALGHPAEALPSDTGDFRAKLVLTEARICPLCGSDDDSRVYADARIEPEKLDGFAFASRKLPEYMHHRLVRCAQCDLVYATPVPRQGTLEQAYQDALFDSAEESLCAARTGAAYTRRILHRLPNRAGALDIGSGDGAFLWELLKMRFSHVEGVEPSAAPIAAARERVRPLIRQTVFNPNDYEPESFSLITCFQVIEHVPDPLELVRGAARLLKPGGAFLMICHNRDALSAKVLGTRSPIFDIEHLQLFSMRTAKKTLRRGGLLDVRGFGVVNRYPLHYYAKLMPIAPGVKGPLLSGLRRSALGRIAIPAALGNLGVVGFKPR